MNFILRTLCGLLLFVVAFGNGPAEARQIVDMFGRNVTVPDKIQRVYGTSPIATYMVYSLNPELVVGLNSPTSQDAKPYLRPEYLAQPVIGGWFGQGKVSNLEVLLQVKPDIILICTWSRSAINEKIEKALEPFHIPIVYAYFEKLSEYPDAYRFLGHLFNLEERGEQLAAYSRKILDDSAKIRAGLKADEHSRIYYAEGPKGLQTECDSSIHSQLITLSGGSNVHKCNDSNPHGLVTVSMEQILHYAPEVIVTHDDEFFATVRTDKKWRAIKAVQTGRIYKIPTQPFNWFDRPPSFMRLLGLEWLQNVLYQQPTTDELIAEIQNFYRVFLGVELSAAEAQQLLSP